jgi:hypothetical protein
MRALVRPLRPTNRLLTLAFVRVYRQGEVWRFVTCWFGTISVSFLLLLFLFDLAVEFVDAFLVQLLLRLPLGTLTLAQFLDTFMKYNALVIHFRNVVFKFCAIILLTGLIHWWLWWVFECVNTQLIYMLLQKESVGFRSQPFYHICCFLTGAYLLHLLHIITLFHRFPAIKIWFLINYPLVRPSVLFTSFYFRFGSDD